MYGALGRAVRAVAAVEGSTGSGAEAVARANWEGGCKMSGQDRPLCGQQSNSGEWDGLISDITSAMEEAECIEEEVEEGEQSWEEAAMNAALAPMTFSYDSSYDSTISEVADEMQQALAQFEQAPAPAPVISVEQKVPVEVEKQMKGPEKGEKAADAVTAGMEFSSGVHLIEEMENQVKQWEESEASREEAYKAFVAMQMAQAAGNCPVMTF